MNSPATAASATTWTTTNAVTHPSHQSNSERVLQVGCPNLGDRAVFERLVDQIFVSRRFTNGGVIEQEFEARLCDYLGVAHCIPVCNATVGLQLACQALQLTGEVILPAFTFVATPHAMRWLGLQPIFADVDRKTHSICPRQVESLITEKTSAIVGVHLWGNACATRQLELLGNKYGIPVLYDAAHAFGCSQQGRMIGNAGRCEVFSFHATKFFNTFEGGAVATNDDELAHRIRAMKNFGFDGTEDVIHLGTNAKLPEISAAMGISMFAKLDDLLQHNHANYNAYHSRLDGTPGLTVFKYDPLEHSNWQYVVIDIDAAEFGICAINCCSIFICTMCGPGVIFIPVATGWNRTSQPTSTAKRNLPTRKFSAITSSASPRARP